MRTYEQLLRIGVFTIGDVDAIFNNRNSSDSAVRALLKKGLITRIKKNLYVCNNIESRSSIADKFKIGSCITKEAYISHHSALEFHGVGHQLFFEVYVSTPFAFKPFEFDGITYQYVASKTNEGVVRYETNRGVCVTDLERTVIDCIKDLDKTGGMEELLQCLRLITYLDSKKLIRYLKIYNIQFLYQKTGYILEHFKNEFKLTDDVIEFCLGGIKKSKRYLCGDDEKNLIYNSKWRLLVPENLLDFMEQGGDELV